MLRTSSTHVLAAETLGKDIWTHLQYDKYRPNLNVHLLVQILRACLENSEDDSEDDADNTGNSDAKGKKRALEEDEQERPSKRIRTVAGFALSKSYQNVSYPPDHYPYLDYFISTRALTSDDQRGHPEIEHQYDISFSTGEIASGDVQSQQPYTSNAYKKLHAELTELVEKLRTKGLETIDMGALELSVHQSRIVAKNKWLFLVPSFGDDDFDPEWYDLPSRVKDIFFASTILHAAGRASIRSRLQIHLLDDSVESNRLPVQFQFNVSVHLAISGLLDTSKHRVDKHFRLAEVDEAQRRVLDYLFPPTIATPPTFDGSINIPFFYSILTPAPELEAPNLYEALQPSDLKPTLLPFQRRSVSWLLGREGKIITPNGQIQEKPLASPEDSLPSFWAKIRIQGSTLYLNRLSGYISEEAPDFSSSLGGILAEEPGLGKTLETITMIMLNPAPPERNYTVSRWDPEAKLEVRATKATLIVTPPALASQWADELKVHAPTLKVLMYDGWAKVPVPITKSQVQEAKDKLRKGTKNGKKAAKPKATGWRARAKSKAASTSADDAMDVDEETPAPEDDIEVQDWYSYVDTFDVVIVTYATLRSDFNVALAAPERPRRNTATYTNLERPRSPLVMVEWYRVVMDEVQMVGGGKTEDMVSLIPRLSSFAVSGTPARAQASDLIHVLKFLRVDHIIGNNKFWNRMLNSGFGATHFAELFKTYAIRTLKSQVKEELTIPQQTRFLVNIKLGPVERHVYDQALEAALLELGLDARGVAAVEGWVVDGQILRTVIRKLRGICTHPQVGQLQRANERVGHKPGAVKTMEEVLQGMREDNWKKLMDDLKSKIQVVIRIAQLQSRDGDELGRFRTALNSLIEAEAEATSLIEEVQAAIDKLGPQANGSGHHTNGTAASSSKGKERAESNDESEEEEDEDVAEERSRKRGGLQNRLRECRIVLHQAKFLQGDMYHSLGEDYAEEEALAYGAADQIRKDLLKGTEGEAIAAMSQLEQDSASKHLSKRTLHIKLPFLDDSDLQEIRQQYDPKKQINMCKRTDASLELLAEGNFIAEDVLNEQTKLIWEWRTRIIALLTQGLGGSGDNPDGEEYQRTLDNQGEAETYLQTYAYLLSDRRQTLTAERTALAAHDTREKQDRQTRAALNALGLQDLVDLQVELQPEHEVLVAELNTKRKNILKLVEGRAVKSILVDLNAAQAQIGKDKDPEKLLLKEYVGQLRHFISEQNSLMDKFDSDLALLRKAFNQRILYFRQLQEISDSVEEITWEGALLDALTEASTEKQDLATSVKTARARQRYLENLAADRKANQEDEDEDGTCILCRCEFIRGFITHCAHVFCEACMKAWLQRREGKTCPVCRVPISPEDLQRVKMSSAEAPAPAKPQPGTVTSEPVPKSRRQISYNFVDSTMFENIQGMESYGDYGSKIQTLIKHLLYLKFSEPGSKSIVFSAWADSLTIMEHALKDNGIGCLRIDQKSKGESAVQRFKNNPSLLVLLLHGERENAGLNITCASRVFLLESVVHHGFEVQAIARIDRMGQTRPTEVFCYYAEETVERNILDLAARKGLSLYTKENSAGTLNITSLGAEEEVKIDNSPKKKLQKKGDFIFKFDDMLAILFPHMFEELDYLIPVDANTASGADESQSMQISSPVLTNAIAGPSRLPYNAQG